MTTAPAVEDVQIKEDLELDPDIRFSNKLSPHALQPKAIFLTGATGFVGAFLIDELMRKTDATVYCLVRGSEDQAEMDRLVTHLRSYDLWHDSYLDRLWPVNGDLTQPRFGLNEGEFTDLAAECDAVYHSAGWLNMAYPYPRIRPVNVNGTREILRFAGRGRTKPLHFLSSMVVFFSDAHTGDPVLTEFDDPLYSPTLKGGYSKSKWVADRLVATAQDRGLPACIYRPVRILGHSQTGAINDLNDILPLLLKGCILFGKYPALDIKVTMVPVDYVTRAMVHLAGVESSWGRAFHFFHPEPIKWSALIDIIRGFGYGLEEVPYEQWIRDLKRRAQNRETPADLKSFFATLLMVLTAPHFLFYKRPPLDSTSVRIGLEETGIECPPIDQQLMATYFDYWRKIGYVPAPPRDNPAAAV